MCEYQHCLDSVEFIFSLSFVHVKLRTKHLEWTIDYINFTILISIRSMNCSVVHDGGGTSLSSILPFHSWMSLSVCDARKYNRLHTFFVTIFRVEKLHRKETIPSTWFCELFDFNVHFFWKFNAKRIYRDERITICTMEFNWCIMIMIEWQNDLFITFKFSKQWN